MDITLPQKVRSLGDFLSANKWHLCIYQGDFTCGFTWRASANIDTKPAEACQCLFSGYGTDPESACHKLALKLCTPDTRICVSHDCRRRIEDAIRYIPN